MNTVAREAFDRYPSVYPLRDLFVTFCGFELENPYILSAAPSTDELDIVRHGLAMGWAGAILKTTSVAGTRVSLTYPMMTGWRSGDYRLLGMGNIDLISVYHIDEIVARVKVLKKEFPRKLIAASIMGQNKEAWQTLAATLRKAGVDLIECSFSCPQGSMGEKPGAMLAQSVEATERVARWVKEAADTTPVLIKITPLVTDITSVAQAAVEAGAHALSLINTLPAMAVDLGTRRPVLANIVGGLSGPAIRPVALRLVWQVARAVGVPVVGLGGIMTARDALEFLLAGAWAVQVGTASFVDPMAALKVLEGLETYFAEHDIPDLDSFVGKLKTNS